MDVEEIRTAYPKPVEFSRATNEACYCIGGALVMYRTVLRWGAPAGDVAAFTLDQRYPDSLHVAMQLARETGYAFTDTETESLHGCPDSVLREGPLPCVSRRARALVLASDDLLDLNDRGCFDDAWSLLGRLLAGDLAQYLEALPA